MCIVHLQIGHRTDWVIENYVVLESRRVTGNLNESGSGRLVSGLWARDCAMWRDIGCEVSIGAEFSVQTRNAVRLSEY